MKQTLVRLSEQRHQQILYITTAMNTLEKKAKDIILEQVKTIQLKFFSTSHVIPHIRALVPCPGLTSEVSVVASTSVSLTPTEILFFCRVPDRNTVFL